jgi:CBS-domain-containing membrane protein
VRLFSDKFDSLRVHFWVQSLAAAVAVALLMLLAGLIDSQVVVASLGASVFIACAAPHSKTTRARYFLGGYFCGIAAGLLCYALDSAVDGFPLELAAGLAVGLTVLAMVAFELEHPPAAALALGLVMAPHTLIAVSIAVGCITLISLTLHFCRPYMRDLL